MAWVDRSYFVTRRRYRLAGLAGSVVAVAATAFQLVPNVHGADAPLVADAGWGTLGAALMLGLAAAVPPSLASLGWRLHRRRYLLDA
jgi:hypothetical protein